MPSWSPRVSPRSGRIRSSTAAGSNDRPTRWCWPPASASPTSRSLRRSAGAAAGRWPTSGPTAWRATAVRTPDGALLHATVDGSEDAPVTLVLAHGWTLAQAAWDDVAELLSPRVAAGELRLIRYDQRGHGRSTWGSAPDVTPISID